MNQTEVKSIVIGQYQIAAEEYQITAEEKVKSLIKKLIFLYKDTIS